MVFCCIAIVGIAIIYFIGLWARQLFLGPRKDENYPRYKPPPRALWGNGALPVYGHTRLFSGKYAGDVALLFPSTWHEVNFIPYTRQLGECFAIFIWGQWRIAIKGTERCKKILSTTNLKEGWPWTPPIALLGKSCLCFLEDEPATQLQQLMKKPLSHNIIIQYAPAFATLAKHCLQDIENGLYTRRKTKQAEENSYSYNQQQHQQKQSASTRRTSAGLNSSELGYGTDDNDDYEDNDSTNAILRGRKVKWEALRSYSFALIDGPILAMNKWCEEDKEENEKGDETDQFVDEQQNNNNNNKQRRAYKRKRKRRIDIPSRETMILYMDRMKCGLDVIKMTFGPEWMYVWLMNEYGRAINARMHIEKVFEQHITHVSHLSDVKHQRGHAFHDPTTQPIPFLTIHKNIIRNNEDIFGEQYNTNNNNSSNHNDNNQDLRLRRRPRANSAPGALTYESSSSSSEEDDDDEFYNEYVWDLSSSSDHDDDDADLVPPLISAVTTEEDEEDNNNANLIPSSTYTLPFQPMKFGQVFRRPDGLLQVTPEKKINNKNEKTTSTTTTTVIDPPLPSSPPPVPKPSLHKSFTVSPNRHIIVEEEIERNRTRPRSRSFSEITLRQTSSPPFPVQSSNIRKCVTAGDNNNSNPKEKHLGWSDELWTTTNERNNNTLNSMSSPAATATTVATTADDGSILGTPKSNSKKGTPQRLSGNSNQKDKYKKTPRLGRKLLKASKRHRFEMGGMISLLENLLRQQDENGNGVSQVVATEVSIMLWMILDAGNAWTAMALNLLSRDKDAYYLVQEEIDELVEQSHHRRDSNSLYTSEIMGKMVYLDALIYESIRLCPPFLGGLKVTSETVELDNDRIQVPKGSHVFFCRPTEEPFDIRRAVGKKLERLGKEYPSIDLYGFLPFQGIEIPLMVLQTKVFLIVFLKDYAVLPAKKKKLFPRVRAVGQRIKRNSSQPASRYGSSQGSNAGSKILMDMHNASFSSDSDHIAKDRTNTTSPPIIPKSLKVNNNNINNNSNMLTIMTTEEESKEMNQHDDNKYNNTNSNMYYNSGSDDVESGESICKVTYQEASRMFTKIPFPEPRRVVRLRPRHALSIELDKLC